MTTTITKKKKNNNDIKTIVVESGKYKMSINVDTLLFDVSDNDLIILEACTQAYEKGIKNKKLKITPIMEVSLVTGGKTKIFFLNSYKILINAGNFKLAETMRQRGLKEFNIDLNNEPIRSKSNGRS